MCMYTHKNFHPILLYLLPFLVSTLAYNYKSIRSKYSYLQAVEDRKDKSKLKEERDQSKPYVPLLERSSQLIEEGVLSKAVKLEIDATPFPSGGRLQGRGALQEVD